MNTFRGLSFVEMLVVLAVFSLIMVSIVNSILLFYRANTSTIEQEYQVENARRALEVFFRDMREATFADTGAYPLQEIGTSTIVFYSDTDLDNSVERIRYDLTGTTLTRAVTDASGSPPHYTGVAATTTISTHVRNASDGTPVFRYYDASSTEVTNPALIATVVSVTITTVVDITERHTPGKFTLKGSATIRNLRIQ